MKLRMYLRGLGLGFLLAVIVLSFDKSSNKEKLTDAEIIVRARELGMVEQKSTLSEEIKKSGEDKNAAPDESIIKADKTQEEAKDEAVEASDDSTVANVPVLAPAQETPDEKEEDKNKGGDEKNDGAINGGDAVDIKQNNSDKKEEKKDNKPEENKENKQEEKKDKIDIKQNTSDSNVKTTSRTEITIVPGTSSYAVAQLLEKGGAVSSASDFDKFMCDKDYDNRIATGTHVIPEGATYEDIAKILTTRQ